jgi:hypothetical protein
MVKERQRGDAGCQGFHAATSRVRCRGLDEERIASCAARPHACRGGLRGEPGPLR